MCHTVLDSSRFSTEATENKPLNCLYKREARLRYAQGSWAATSICSQCESSVEAEALDSLKLDLDKEVLKCLTMM